MLEVRHLHLIKEIAEKESLTAAAKKLFLTQPSLSHQLKEIETKLDARLFHRVNRKMVITAAGKQVLAAAEQILPILSRTEKEIKQKSTGVYGEIRLCMECYTGYHWFPAVLKKFQSRFPFVEMDIVTEAMSEPVNHLLKGKIDLAMLINLPERNKNIILEKLFEDEQVLVVHHDHPLALKEFVKPRELVTENLIIYRESLEENHFARHYLIPANIKPVKVTKMQLTEASIELVKAGMGVAVLSRWLTKPFLSGENKIRLVRINKNGVFRPWYLAYLKQTIQPTYLKMFIEFIKKEKLGGN